MSLRLLWIVVFIFLLIAKNIDYDMVAFLSVGRKDHHKNIILLLYLFHSYTQIYCTRTTRSYVTLIRFGRTLYIGTDAARRCMFVLREFIYFSPTREVKVSAERT